MHSASSVSWVYEAPPSRLTPLTIGKVRENLVPRLGRGDKKKGTRCQGRRCYKVTDDVFQVVVSGRGSWLRPGLQSCYIDLYPNPAVCLASWGKPRSEKLHVDTGDASLSLFLLLSFFSASLSFFIQEQSICFKTYHISATSPGEKEFSGWVHHTLDVFTMSSVATYVRIHFIILRRQLFGSGR